MADLKFNKIGIDADKKFYKVETPFDASNYQTGDIVFAHNDDNDDLRLFVIENEGEAVEVTANAIGLELKTFVGNGVTDTLEIPNAVEIYKSGKPGTLTGTTFTFDEVPADGENIKIFYYVSTTRLGTVIPDGYTIKIDEKGIISATKILAGNGLMIDDTDTLQLVPNADGRIVVDEDGISVDATKLSPATDTDLGVVKVDNDTITVDATGTIKAAGKIVAGEAIKVTDGTDDSGKSIKTVDALYDNSTIKLGTDNKLYVNLDNSSIKNDGTDKKLYVNLDGHTLKQYATGTDKDKLYVEASNMISTVTNHTNIKVEDNNFYVDAEEFKSSVTNHDNIAVENNDFYVDANKLIYTTTTAKDNIKVLDNKLYVDASEMVNDATSTGANHIKANTTNNTFELDVNKLVSSTTGQDNLSVGDNNTLYVNAQKLIPDIAPGISDSNTLQVSGNKLSVNTQNLDKATASQFGVVKVDNSTVKSTDGVISIDTQNLDKTSKTQLGVVQIGDNVDVDDGVISIKKASSTELGLVKTENTITNTNGSIGVNYDNDTIKKATDGKLYVNTASKTQLGAVKLDNDTIKMDATSKEIIVSTASDTQLGAVKLDNDTIKMDATSKKISVSKASNTQLGAVKTDNVTIKADANAVISGQYTADGNGIELDSTDKITFKLKYDDTTVKVGSDKKLYVPTATDSALGVIKYDNSTIKKDANDKIYANLDNDTIKNDGTDNKIYVNFDGTTIKKDSSNKYGVNIDDATIKYDATNKVYVPIAGNSKTQGANAKRGSVIVDGDTITIDANGVIKSSGGIVAGEAVKLTTATVGGVTTNTLDVLYDNDTIKLSSNKLTAEKATDTQFGVVKYDNDTIKKVSDQLVVNFDGKTIVKDSDNKYSVNTDEDTIKKNSTSGKLEVQFDGKTLKKNSTSNKYEVNIDKDTLVADANGVISVDTDKLEKASATQFGIVEVDNKSIISTGGVISVQGDGKSIGLDTDGKVTTKVDASGAIDNSGALKVNVDDTTVKIVSNKITGQYTTDNKGIELDSTDKITFKLKYDDESVKVNSNNKLYVNIDEKTIKKDTADSNKLAVQYDGKVLTSPDNTYAKYPTISYDSTDGLRVNLAVENGDEYKYSETPTLGTAGRGGVSYPDGSRIKIDANGKLTLNTTSYNTSTHKFSNEDNDHVATTYAIAQAIADQSLLHMQASTDASDTPLDYPLVKEDGTTVVGTMPPAANTRTTIYLVRRADGKYEQYATTFNEATGIYAFVDLGIYEIDLSGYVQKSTTIAGIDLKDDITNAEMVNALIGNTLENVSDKIEAKKATATTYGIVKADNSTIKADANGVISAEQHTHEGKRSIKVTDKTAPNGTVYVELVTGNGVEETADGKLQVKAKTNGNVVVDENGVSVPEATSTTYGVVMYDGLTIKEDANKKLTLNVDDKTIKKKTTGEVYVNTATGSGLTTDATAGTLKVFVDDSTIKINTDGKLQAVAAAPEVVTPIKLTDGKIDLAIDTNTLEIKDGKLSATAKPTGEEGITVTADNVVKHTNVLSSGGTDNLYSITYDKNGHITATNVVTADDGIKYDGHKILHTNSVTAQTTQNLQSITYDAQGHITAGTAITTDRGIDVTSNKIGHTNSVTANTTNGLKKFKYDAQGHITEGTDVTIGDALEITSTNVLDAKSNFTPNTNNNLKVFNVDKYGRVSSSTDIELTDSGLIIDSNVLKHSNSVTAATDNKIRSFKYDKFGHITGTPDVITLEQPLELDSNEIKLHYDGKTDAATGTILKATNNDLYVRTAVDNGDTFNTATAVVTNGSAGKKGVSFADGLTIKSTAGKLVAQRATNSTASTEAFSADGTLSATPVSANLIKIVDAEGNVTTDVTVTGTSVTSTKWADIKTPVKITYTTAYGTPGIVIPDGITTKLVNGVLTCTVSGGGGGSSADYSAEQGVKLNGTTFSADIVSGQPLKLDGNSLYVNYDGKTDSTNGTILQDGSNALYARTAVSNGDTVVYTNLSAGAKPTQTITAGSAGKKGVAYPDGLFITEDDNGKITVPFDETIRKEDGKVGLFWGTW